MQSAAKQGGAHIIVPPGTFLLKGPIHFVSNVCLELMDGAIIKFDSNPKYYLPLVKQVGKAHSYIITVRLFMDIIFMIYQSLAKENRWQCLFNVCNMEVKAEGRAGSQP